MTWETPVPPNSCPETTAYLRRANADYFVSGRRAASTRERKGPKISADSSLGEEQIRSQANILKPGGGSGIRTHVTVSRKHAFQACAFSHSATPPV